MSRRELLEARLRACIGALHTRTALIVLIGLITGIIAVTVVLLTGHRVAQTSKTARQTPAAIARAQGTANKAGKTAAGAKAQSSAILACLTRSKHPARGLDVQAGPAGAAGGIGPAGATGARGLRGIQGARGPSGPPGGTGPAGLPCNLPECKGPQGPPGTRGEEGAPGDAGAKGDTGTPGVPGQVGATGEPGPQGPPGPPGSQGPPGPQGPPGEPGAAPTTLSCVPNVDAPGTFTCTPTG